MATPSPLDELVCDLFRLLRRLLRLKRLLRLPLQLLKLRTNLRKINFVCLQRLMEHYVMMKDRLVKTVNILLLTWILLIIIRWGNRAS
jgi:hypothetical protein